MPEKQREVNDQNREIRTKNKEDVSTDDRPLSESLPEESFLRKRKRSESANRRNTTARGKISSQVPALPPITEKSHDSENTMEIILNKYPVGVVTEGDEPFFLKWSLKNKSRLIHSGTA